MLKVPFRAHSSTLRGSPPCQAVVAMQLRDPAVRRVPQDLLPVRRQEVCVTGLHPKRRPECSPPLKVREGNLPNRELCGRMLVQVASLHDRSAMFFQFRYAGRNQFSHRAAPGNPDLFYQPPVFLGESLQQEIDPLVRVPASEECQTIGRNRSPGWRDSDAEIPGAGQELTAPARDSSDIFAEFQAICETIISRGENLSQHAPYDGNPAERPDVAPQGPCAVWNPVFPGRLHRPPARWQSPESEDVVGSEIFCCLLDCCQSCRQDRDDGRPGSRKERIQARERQPGHGETSAPRGCLSRSMRSGRGRRPPRRSWLQAHERNLIRRFRRLRTRQPGRRGRMY